MNARSTGLSPRTRGRRTTAPRRRAGLGLESLEARWTPAVFNVNTLADGFNLGPGVLSLRQAIQMANATPGGNTINLTVPGTYQLSSIGPGTGNNLNGALAILPSGGNLTIQNKSGGAAAVSGDGTDRVFDINPANTGTNSPFLVKLVGFTIENGVASPGDGAGGSGGGIRDQGNASLELDYVTVTNNLATADGGGIAMENTANVPWKLTLNNSVVTNNHAGDAGGGIDEDGQGTIAINAGSVIGGNTTVNQGAGLWLDAINGVTANTTITGTVIQYNVAFAGVGGGVGNAGSGNVVFNDDAVKYNYSGATGGGFGDEGNTGNLTVEGGSVFQFNAAAQGGGGIQDAGPLAIVTEATISDNFTQGQGGGILAADPATTATGTTVLAVFDSTISRNVATDGGGIEDTGSLLNITSSLFMNNKALGLNGGTDGNGGAIDAATPAQGANAAGTINVAQTLFFGNVAGNGGAAGAGDGGAIHQAVGTLNVDRSEFVSNAAGHAGGAIAFAGTSFHATASTFFGNRSVAGGGAVEFLGSGTLGAGTFSYLINDTFTGNLTAGNGGAVEDGGAGDFILVNDTINGNAAKAGGIAWGGTGHLALQNTVVAQDAPAPGGGTDVSTSGASVVDLGGNFIGTLSGSTGFSAKTLTGDAKLGPLASNGGPLVGTLATNFGLLTEAPLSGSPLLAAGVAANAPATDARGRARPTNTPPTIGAYQA